MSYAVTANLEPRAFFCWFEEISKIPHGSLKEQKLMAFLEAYAKERGFFCETDGIGNVYMQVPATAGYEEVPSVLFQAHTDMVWAKAPDVEFDFETQPLRLAIDGDKLHAQGTTLGADNAVGIATMLALGDTEDIPHPPLEFLFTVQEEVGMFGVRAFDMGKIKSRRMINMDCGDSHVLAVSSAGRVHTQIRKTYAAAAVPADHACLRLHISGGLGGHSGLAINKGRCCAGNAMGDLLVALEEIPVRLCTMAADGPILKSCTATVALPQDKLEEAADILNARFAEIQAVHIHADPDIKLEIEACQAASNAIDAQATMDIAQVLSLLRTMQYRVDCDDPAIIITSGAVGDLSLQDGAWKMSYGFRSSLDADQEMLIQRHTRLAKQFGMALERRDGYPGWPERQDSAFRAKFIRLHEKLFGEGMALERVPGGIEVGVVVAAIPDMDPVGIAPTARGAHTPQEHLFISQVEPYWTLLKAVLAEKD